MIKRKHKELSQHNWLAEANQKAVIAENVETGEKLCFRSIKELQAHFNTKANIQRMLKNDRPVKTHKSKLYGWYIHLASPNQGADK